MGFTFGQQLASFGTMRSYDVKFPAWEVNILSQIIVSESEE
jgi:hypothetical protein